MAFLRRFSNLVKPWGGKHVRIGLSSSNSPLFQSTRSIRSISWKRLFIGGLDYSVNERDLKEAFEPYGQLKYVLVIRNPIGRSRGFGFITFESAKAADEAILDMNGEELWGRRIKVSEARPHPIWGFEWDYEADPYQQYLIKPDPDKYIEKYLETCWISGPHM